VWWGGLCVCCFCLFEFCYSRNSLTDKVIWLFSVAKKNKVSREKSKKSREKSRKVEKSREKSRKVEKSQEKSRKVKKMSRKVKENYG
jgi:hypothetical protein